MRIYVTQEGKGAFNLVFDQMTLALDQGAGTPTSPCLIGGSGTARTATGRDRTVFCDLFRSFG